MMTKWTASVLSALLMWTGMVLPASAAIIDTQQALAVETRETRIADIQAQLARDDVREALIERGVDPDEAQSRVASLSDHELVTLQNNIDALPAGSGIIWLAGLVLLVLLLTDFVGATDVYNDV